MTVEQPTNEIPRERRLKNALDRERKSHKAIRVTHQRLKLAIEFCVAAELLSRKKLDEALEFVTRFHSEEVVRRVDEEHALMLPVDKDEPEGKKQHLTGVELMDKLLAAKIPYTQPDLMPDDYDFQIGLLGVRNVLKDQTWEPEGQLCGFRPNDEGKMLRLRIFAPEARNRKKTPLTPVTGVVLADSLVRLGYEWDQTGKGGWMAFRLSEDQTRKELKRLYGDSFDWKPDGQFAVFTPDGKTLLVLYDRELRSAEYSTPPVLTEEKGAGEAESQPGEKKTPLTEEEKQTRRSLTGTNLAVFLNGLGYSYETTGKTDWKAFRLTKSKVQWEMGFSPTDPDQWEPDGEYALFDGPDRLLVLDALYVHWERQTAEYKTPPFLNKEPKPWESLTGRELVNFLVKQGYSYTADPNGWFVFDKLTRKKMKHLLSEDWEPDGVLCQILKGDTTEWVQVRYEPREKPVTGIDLVDRLNKAGALGSHTENIFVTPKASENWLFFETTLERVQALLKEPNWVSDGVFSCQQSLARGKNHFGTSSDNRPGLFVYVGPEPVTQKEDEKPIPLVAALEKSGYKPTPGKYWGWVYFDVSQRKVREILDNKYWTADGMYADKGSLRQGWCYFDAGAPQSRLFVYVEDPSKPLDGATLKQRLEREGCVFSQNGPGWWTCGVSLTHVRTVLDLPKDWLPSNPTIFFDHPSGARSVFVWIPD